MADKKMSFKIDFHVHSVASKDGLATVEMIARAAKKKGLDAVFICDHNCYSLNAPREIDGVWLFPGCEISTSDAHVLALFCNPIIDMSKFKNGKISTDYAIQTIRSHGGVSVIAHPYDHVWSFEGLREKPDGTEVFNARAWMRNKNANNMANDYARRFNLIEFAGSDAHCIDEIGNAYTVVLCDDIKNLKEAVLARKTEAVAVANTKRIYKGKSQLKKHKADGRLLKGIAYYIYCFLGDIFGR